MIGGGVSALLVAACATLAAAEAARATDATIIVGTDTRRTLPTEPHLLTGDYSATGIIECGGMRSTGQVTGRGDRVTSAAHAFYDEAGRSRAESGRCIFTVEVGGAKRVVSLTPEAARCGSTSPYSAAGHHDWAVARLAEPIAGLRPYRFGGTPSVG